MAIAVLLSLLTGFLLFTGFYKVRFSVEATIDVLNYSAEYCVSLFKRTVYCGRAQIEKGDLVIYDKKDLPIFIPIKIKRIDAGKLAVTLKTPLYDKLHMYSLSLYAAIGKESDAFFTAMAMCTANMIGGAVLGGLKSANRGLKVSGGFVPAYGKNVAKFALNGIFGVTIGNIILYTLHSALGYIYRAATRDRRLRTKRKLEK